MQQPERVYYPLVNVAKELECEVDYLIHLAAVGLAELCVKYEVNFRAANSWLGGLDIESLERAAIKSEARGEKLTEITVRVKNHYLEAELNIINAKEVPDGENYFLPSDVKKLSGVLKIPDSVMKDIDVKLSLGKTCETKKLCIPNTTLRFDGGRFLDLNDRLSFDAENGLSFDFYEPLFITSDDLLMTHEELSRLRSKSFPSFAEITGYEPGTITSIDPFENPKTQTNVVALTRVLFSLIPNLSNVDIDDISDEKLKELLYFEAKSKGVTLPNIHFQTLAKYFGGSRPKRKKLIES